MHHGALSHCRAGNIVADPGLPFYFVTPGVKFYVSVDGAAADRAGAGKNPRTGALRPLFRHSAHHFGDNIAGPLHNHGISNMQILGPHLILIMQGGGRDDNAAHSHRIEFCYGREHAGASDLDLDISQNCLRLLSLKLERHGETRCPGRKAKLLLRLKVVDLGHSAVNLHEVLRPFLVHTFHIGLHFRETAADCAAWRRGKAPALKKTHEISMRARGGGIPPVGSAHAV